MQRFKYIIVSSAVVLALTAANLSAQQGPSRPGGTSGGGGGGGRESERTHSPVADGRRTIRSAYVYSISQ